MPLPDKRPFLAHLQTIGDHVKQARLQRRILIKEVAAVLDITRETLRGWELGTFEPHVRHYPAIIRFLGYYPFQVETNTLGGRIRTYRFINGLTQDQFAALIGTDRSTLWWWESNKRPPITKTLKVIEKILASNPLTG